MVAVEQRNQLFIEGAVEGMGSVLSQQQNAFPWQQEGVEMRL